MTPTVNNPPASCSPPWWLNNPLTWHVLFSDLWHGVHQLLVQTDQDGALLSSPGWHASFYRRTEQWPAGTFTSTFLSLKHWSDDLNGGTDIIRVYYKEPQCATRIHSGCMTSQQWCNGSKRKFLFVSLLWLRCLLIFYLDRQKGNDTHSAFFTFHLLELKNEWSLFKCADLYKIYIFLRVHDWDVEEKGAHWCNCGKDK